MDRTQQPLPAGAGPLTDLKRLAIHTITNRPWSLEQCIRHYSRAGVAGVTVWRYSLEGQDVRQAGRRIREAGLEVGSLVRGGFYAAPDEAGRRKAVEENLRIIDEAADLGAPWIVLVCGAVPGQPLEESRRQIRDGIAATLAHAAERGVRLGIEPLHPMFADSRSAVNTLRQANDLAEELASPWVGVVVDVYHLWWDPDLEEQIRRTAALGKLWAFHICDWRVPTEDMLNDRGLMGEGCIPVRRIRGWVEAAGFGGFNEVEIFSNRLWAMDQEEFLARIVDAYRNAS
jgi:sugar phosphate isomerase/epimerase